MLAVLMKWKVRVGLIRVRYREIVSSTEELKQPLFPCSETI
jgi:hypothetical protein